MTEDFPIKVPRKLIEVALPLDAINTAAKSEKAVPRRGHPQTLHYWWARRPLAAARTVVFAQTVNDPSFQRGSGFRYGKNKKEAALERKRLFGIIEELAKWENTNNKTLLDEARAEIRRSWREICDLNRNHPDAGVLFDPNRLPPFYDIFAGGGAIPLEAQRLGFESHASDLNPVAVLINKSTIDIPYRFINRPPIHPNARDDSCLIEKSWFGLQGLAEDIRHYGEWILNEAKKRFGGIYPKMRVSEKDIEHQPHLEHLKGKELPVLAWLWARTVKSPNPAFSQCEVPLSSTFLVSRKKTGDIYIEPIIRGSDYHFVVKTGEPTAPEIAGIGTKLGRGAKFRCLLSDVAIEPAYVKSEAMKGRLGVRMMAAFAETDSGRVYLSPHADSEAAAKSCKPSWAPEIPLCGSTQYLGVKPYGMDGFADLFTPRQLFVMGELSSLVNEVKSLAEEDAIAAGLGSDGVGLDQGGVDATAYAEAIVVYLSCALSRLATYNNAICHWNVRGGSVAQIFARQAIPMSWDFIEVNPLEKMSGNWDGGVQWVADAVEQLLPQRQGYVEQCNASSIRCGERKAIFSTDPPYYDNVPYADLSDLFYSWLRPVLKPIFPGLFSRVAVPKAEELVSFAHRHDGKEKASKFFLDGMTETLARMADASHPAFPITIYYAFKQSDTEEAGTTSTGWETFLESTVRAGLEVRGTWPMSTERIGRSRHNSSNALASSIVLVCQKRNKANGTASRRAFIRELNEVLPEALDEMTRGIESEQSPVAPVDLSQAIIGPGMSVFSKYEAVLEADGSPMSVRTALQLINRYLAEDDFDVDTQFCLHWFEQHGWEPAGFGEADVLARAKATSVAGLADAGVILSSRGPVRLLKWTQYSADWDPKKDFRTPVWESLHHLIRSLKQDGESAAGQILDGVASRAEGIRQLGYRLYTVCERKRWAEDARAYNEFITSWSAIESAAPKVSQQELF